MADDPAEHARSDVDPVGGAPSRWEADVVVADGGTVHIRPIRASDAESLVTFHERQSPDSVYLRYFTAMPRLTPRMLDNLTQVDQVDRMGLVALLGDEIVAMASFDTRPDRASAEVAFMVDDEHQGRGLATVLLEYLVVAAREVGLGALTAMVLPSNRRMLSVFARAGFEQRRAFQDGVMEVVLDIQPSGEAVALVDERERRAAARSVARLLAPGSIAVVGAGREPGGLGHELFRNLLTHGFNGPVYPVNPSGGHVAGVRAWPSLLEVPDDIDVAVLAVPAEAILEIIEQCARKRVRGLLVTTAGFVPTLQAAQVVDEESSSAGVPGTATLLEAARRWGIRLIGPESLGALNTAPAVSMVSTFAPVRVLPGAVGLVSQSGTLGVAALDLASRKGVGISTFIDVGAKADVSGNDILQYWEHDGRTKVGLMYLESFGNPRRFVRIARRMSRTTPLVAVKAGNLRPPTRPGESAEAQHWPADATYGAMLAQCGVIRVDSLNQLFDVARVALHQPVPRGRRVALVSNSRGASAMTRDASVGAGLTLAEMSEKTTERLSSAVAGVRVGSGSVELPFDAGPIDYERALLAVADDEGIDAVVVVYAPATRDRRAEVGRAIGAVADGRRPVLATFLGASTDEPLVAGSVCIPLFEFPSEAVRTLALLAAYGEWLEQPPGELGEVPDGADLDRAQALVAEVLDHDPAGRWLDPAQVAEMCEALSLPLAEAHFVDDADQAVDAATALGFPVVLKATGVHTYYRGEDGGVALDVRSADELRAAFGRMTERLGDAMRPALVQRMAPGGVDALVGVHQHPAIGAVVSLGMGGIASVGNQQRSVGLLPLTDLEAKRLVASSPLAPPFEAADTRRGAERLEGLLLGLSATLEQLPEIADLVANPVIVGDRDLVLTDVRVRVAPATVDLGPAVRRL